jgi:hypothetical protein
MIRLATEVRGGYVCEERLRLLDEFDKAVEAFSHMTTDLKMAVNGSLEDFKSLEQNCTSALNKVRAAKLALWKHREGHCC